MPVLKRLTVWAVERSIEVCLLGCLLGCLVSLNAKEPSLTMRNALAGFWVYGMAVAIFLVFLWLLRHDGFLRCDMADQENLDISDTVVASLFAVHTRIVFVFMHSGSDFTPEGRALELPFALGGAGIVFVCALAGNPHSEQVDPSPIPVRSRALSECAWNSLLGVRAY